jgi:hypothetical protein
MKTIRIIHPISNVAIDLQAESDPAVNRLIYLDEEVLLKGLNIDKSSLTDKEKNIFKNYIKEINIVESIETQQIYGVLTSVVYLKVHIELRKKIRELIIKGDIKI